MDDLRNEKCWKICFWNERGGTKGRKVGGRRERSGVSGMVVIVKEDCWRRGGRAGQVNCVLAKSKYDSGMGKREMGAVLAT
jgi:hypothetical protein